jgi:hypothetical protein
VVNTARVSPSDRSAKRRFSENQANAGHEDDREQRGLAAQDRGEHLAVADLAEPQPVGVEGEGRRSSEEEDAEHHQREEAGGSRHGCQLVA